MGRPRSLMEFEGAPHALCPDGRHVPALDDTTPERPTAWCMRCKKSLKVVRL